MNRVQVVDDVENVSILTRPEGRVQPSWESVSTTLTCFNPHPAEGRVQRLRFCQQTVDKGFNPHPARRPGATESVAGQSGWVQFQSSPGQKAGCNPSMVLPAYGMKMFQSSPGQKAGATARRRHRRRGLPVSILTRPEGRVQRGQAVRPRTPPACFNPHPARRPGATPLPTATTTRSTTCFNPHPARRPGATSPRR